MSYNISSLTPSRPAPPVPGGAGGSRMMQQSRSTSESSSRSNPNFSSSSYASSFPILNPASALNPGAHVHEGRKTVIRTGHANMKEEGIRSFMWPRKWLVLGGTDLQIYKNEVSTITTFWRKGVCADHDRLLPFHISCPSSVSHIAPTAIIVAGIHLQPHRGSRRPTCRSQAFLRRGRDQGEATVLCLQNG